MFIRGFCSGPFQTNTYVIAFEKTKKAAIIDPAMGSKELCLELIHHRQLTPEAIFLTHSHFDHIADIGPLLEIVKIPVYVHPLDAENLRNPGADRLPLPFSLPGIEPDHFLDPNNLLKLGEISLKIIHTPGHSPGGVCFWVPEANVLFSGDTLFRQGIGNLSFPTADLQAMVASLRTLSQLPPDTKVYPGHGFSTNIGAESALLHVTD